MNTARNTASNLRPTELKHVMGLPYSKVPLNTMAPIVGNTRYRVHPLDAPKPMSDPENEKKLVPEPENPATHFYRHTLGLARNMLADKVNGVRQLNLRS